MENIENKKTSSSPVDTINVDKIVEFKKTVPSKLDEILSFIYETLGESEHWQELTPFQHYGLVEQVFLMYFATFPSRVVCAAALACLDEDEYYTSLEEVKQMEIRSVIKNLAMSMKLTKKEAFTISQKAALPAKELIEAGLSKNVIVILFTKELYKKVSKKWGKHNI